MMSIRRTILALSVSTALGTFHTLAADAAKTGGASQTVNQAPAATNPPAAPAAGNSAPVNNANTPTNKTPANNAPPNTAPANSTPSKSNGPNDNTNAGQFSNAPGVRNANDRNEKVENGVNHRGDRRIGRIVYVPGYGYSNWDGNYGSPYWSAPGTWYNNDGYPSNQPSASDRKAVAPARSTHPEEEAAQAEMSSTRARLAKQFEANDDVRAALRDVQEAQHAYDAAVVKANLNLRNNPDYKQAEAEKHQAARKVEAVQAADRQTTPAVPTTQPQPISPEVLRAAQQKLNAASEVSAIAADQAQTDPTVLQAREKLEAAADKLNGMKDKFDSALQSDPQWQSAKQKLDAARTSGTK